MAAYEPELDEALRDIKAFCLLNRIPVEIVRQALEDYLAVHRLVTAWVDEAAGRTRH